MSHDESADMTDHDESTDETNPDESVNGEKLNKSAE